MYFENSDFYFRNTLGFQNFRKHYSSKLPAIRKINEHTTHMDSVSDNMNLVLKFIV